jgi:hypothetical protein
LEFLIAVRRASRAIKLERTSTESSRRRLNRWPPAKKWLATTKHDGSEVESILIDKTCLGQDLRQDWSANLNLASQSTTTVALRSTDLRKRDMTHAPNQEDLRPNNA